MKKFLFGFTFIFAVANLSAKKVKFAVDMSGQIISTFGVHVTGDFQEAAGFPLNWDPSTVTLIQEGSTTIYSAIVTIPAFTKYEYIFINGDQTYESEFVPDESRVGYNFIDNRWMYVDSLQNDTSFVGAILFGGNAPAGLSLVRYKVDMTTAALPYTNGIHVGSSNDNYSPTKFKLYTFGDNIYEIINYYPTNTSYTFIYFNSNTISTSEVIPNECATSGNRSLTLPKDSILPIVCFSSCNSCSSVSVKEIKNSKSHFKSYPNPAKDIVTIESTQNDLIESITLYNLVGQQINHATDINQTNYTISNLNVPAGLYTVRVLNKNKQTHYLKIIIE
jgi:hypothetical protein